MVWVKLDDQFPDHPKIAEAGPCAAWLHVCGIAYCNRHLTDGFIPRGVAHRLTDFDGLHWGGPRNTQALAGPLYDVDCETEATRLVVVGLWKVTDGGYLIHDYHDFQPSRAEVEALRKARSDAGKLGGQASAKAKAEASAKAKRKQTSSNGSSKTQAKFNPVPVPVPDPEPEDLDSPSLLYEVPAFKPRELDSSPLGKLCKACLITDMESEDAAKLARAMRGIAEVHVVDLAESAPKDVRDRLAWTLSELKKRKAHVA